MDDQILYQFSRNQDDKVYFTLRKYKDRKYIDLRIFYKPEDADEMRPTKKGITLAIELLPELKRGIVACEKKIAAASSVSF